MFFWGPAAGREGRFIADRYARINERIRAREVRVIDEEGKQLGIMNPAEALQFNGLLVFLGLDLVEVSPTANPPVCRIINYGKFLYQQSKRQHEAKKHQKSIELKEVKFRPQTSDNDFSVKRNHIIEFLKDGDKVKATIMFKGRQMAHRELGWNMIQRLIADISEVGLVESRPKQEGPNLTAVLAPKKTGGKGSGQKSKPAAKPAGSGAAAPAPAAGVASATERAASDPAPVNTTGATESSGG